MKKLIINSISYKNLLSVGNDPIEIEMSKHHKTLVTGKNGGGKSTILEALCYGLFGKPFRDLKLGQLINTINKKNLVVTIDMTYNNKHIVINRGQKPKLFEIIVDGEKLENPTSDTEFQKQLEIMLDISYNGFKQSVVLGTAGYKAFMTLNSKERREIVEEFLNVNILSNMAALSKKDTSVIKESINAIDLKMSSTKNELDGYLRHQQNAQRQSDEQKEKYNSMRQQIFDEVVTIKEEINILNEQVANFVLGDPVDQQQMNKISSGLGVLGNKIGELTRVVTMYEKGGTCPTCLQDVSQGDPKPLQETICQHESNTIILKERLSELQKAQSEYRNIENQLRDLKSQLNSKRSIIQDKANQIKKIDSMIESLGGTIADYTDDITKLQDKITAFESEREIYTEENYINGIVNNMLKDSGIKASVVSQYIPYFNSRIKHYLDIMNADYLFTLDEEFNETIRSVGREDFSYNSFSQGEKARIDIALLFTWGDVASYVSGLDVSLLMLDEVFDGSLDDIAVKSLMHILTAKEGRNIFIISHRHDQDPEDYDRHIEMKKIGRFSTMTIVK